MHPVGIDPRSGLGVDSSAFRRRAPRVMLSDDPDIATMQTVQEMCRQIGQAARDPLILACAKNAVVQFSGGPGWVDDAGNPFEQPLQMAESCWWWCKHYLRFKHHGDQFEAWSGDLGDPRTKLQLLIAPDVLVRMKRMEGDCAIYTMMLCAMLEALGVQWQIVTLAVDPRQPGVFSHVCCRAIWPDGSEFLDASHGAYPGWRVPDRDIQRAWFFDSAGNRQEAGVRFNGLHGYRARAYRGMGAQVCDESGCYDDGTMPDVNPPSDFGPVTGTVYTPSSAFLCADGSVPPASGVCGGGYQVPQQNTPAYAQLLAQLAKSGVSLAQLNAIPPGTIINPNGQIIRQNPGYAVPIGSSLAANFGSSSSMLYVFGFGIGALLLFSMFSKGRG